MLTQQIATIVDETLIKLDIPLAFRRLVKGTMAFQSGFKELYDREYYSAGFMMLDRGQIYDTVKNFLHAQINFCRKIEEVTGVDINRHDIEAIVSFVEANIALQAVFCYAYYRSVYVSEPDDNPEGLAKCYAKYWLNTEDDLTVRAAFVKCYRDTFTK